MDPTPADAVQVHVQALPSLHAALVDAVKDAGLTAADLHELFASHIAAECVQCGITLGGADLERLGFPASVDPPEDAKLTRLRQGYCARRDCNSYYYRVVLQPHPKVNWQGVIGALGSIAPRPQPGPAAAAAPSPSLAGAVLGGLRSRRVWVGIGLVLLLLVAKHLMSGGRIPLLHRTPDYRVDPASTAPATNRPLESPPPSPAPRRP